MSNDQIHFPVYVEHFSRPEHWEKYGKRALYGRAFKFLFQNVGYHIYYLGSLKLPHISLNNIFTVT